LTPETGDPLTYPATRRLQPLFQKVLASVADQGVASSTNFVMNVLLARWLTRSDYGAFSVAWSFCLVFAAFHNALIVEPMIIIGPSEFGDKLEPYLARVNRFQWLVAAALSVVAALLGFFYREPVVRRSLLGLALCLPGYMLLLTRRREQHVLHQPGKALRFSLIYAVLVGGVLWTLNATSTLSAASGTLAIGVSWLAAFAGRMPKADAGGMLEVAKEHWRYGKWLLASSLLAVGIPDVQTIMLSLLVDLKSAGALRALMNFVLPLSQLMTAFNVYALPRFARRIKQSGTGPGLRHVIFFPALMLMIGFVYMAVLILAGPVLEKVLYGGKMAEYLGYLPLLAAGALLAVVAGGFSTLLRAAQNSAHQFVSGVAGSVVGVGSAFALLKQFGLTGALWSIVLANAAAAAVVIGAYALALRKDPAAWAPLHYLRENK
jgi:O-antigen/teichoic acid export membrane protein